MHMCVVDMQLYNTSLALIVHGYHPLQLCCMWCFPVYTNYRHTNELEHIATFTVWWLYVHVYVVHSASHILSWKLSLV